jgi:hypothetical protein
MEQSKKEKRAARKEQASTWVATFIWVMYIIGGVFALYTWIVSIASLYTGDTLTTWLLSDNVFWYTVALFAWFAFWFIINLIAICFSPRGGFARKVYVTLAVYGFSCTLMFVIDFVLFLSIYQNYGGGASPALPGISATPIGVPHATSNSLAQINIAIDNTNANLAQAFAYANYVGDLVVLLITTTIAVLLTLAIVFMNPWAANSDSQFNAKVRRYLRKEQLIDVKVGANSPSKK